MEETQVPSLGWEDPLEKEMATHSSILAWKIPWAKEPGGLQSMGSQSWTRLSDFTSLGLKTETLRNKTATTRKLTKRWVVAHFLQEVIPGLPT